MKKIQNQGKKGKQRDKDKSQESDPKSKPKQLKDQKRSKVAQAMVGRYELRPRPENNKGQQKTQNSKEIKNIPVSRSIFDTNSGKDKPKEPEDISYGHYLSKPLSPQILDARKNQKKNQFQNRLLGTHISKKDTLVPGVGVANTRGFARKEKEKQMYDKEKEKQKEKSQRIRQLERALQQEKQEEEQRQRINRQEKSRKKRQKRKQNKQRRDQRKKRQLSKDRLSTEQIAYYRGQIEKSCQQRKKQKIKRIKKNNARQQLIDTNRFRSCMQCNTIVPIDQIKQHKNTWKHVVQINRLLKLKEQPLPYNPCNRCGRYIARNHMAKHIDLGPCRKLRQEQQKLCTLQAQCCVHCNLYFLNTGKKSRIKHQNTGICRQIRSRIQLNDKQWQQNHQGSSSSDQDQQGDQDPQDRINQNFQNKDDQSQEQNEKSSSQEEEISQREQRKKKEKRRNQLSRKINKKIEDEQYLRNQDQIMNQINFQELSTRQETLNTYIKLYKQKSNQLINQNINLKKSLQEIKDQKRFDLRLQDQLQQFSDSMNMLKVENLVLQEERNNYMKENEQIKKRIDQVYQSKYLNQEYLESKIAQYQNKIQFQRKNYQNRNLDQSQKQKYYRQILGNKERQINELKISQNFLQNKVNVIQKKQANSSKQSQIINKSLRNQNQFLANNNQRLKKQIDNVRLMYQRGYEQKVKEFQRQIQENQQKFILKENQYTMNIINLQNQLANFVVRPLPLKMEIQPTQEQINNLKIQHFGYNFKDSYDRMEENTTQEAIQQIQKKTQIYMKNQHFKGIAQSKNENRNMAIVQLYPKFLKIYKKQHPQKWNEIQNSKQKKQRYLFCLRQAFISQFRDTKLYGDFCYNKLSQTFRTFQQYIKSLINMHQLTTTPSIVEYYKLLVHSSSNYTYTFGKHKEYKNIYHIDNILQQQNLSFEDYFMFRVLQGPNFQQKQQPLQRYALVYGQYQYLKDIYSAFNQQHSKQVATQSMRAFKSYLKCQTNEQFGDNVQYQQLGISLQQHIAQVVRNAVNNDYQLKKAKYSALFSNIKHQQSSESQGVKHQVKEEEEKMMKYDKSPTYYRSPQRK